MMDSTSIQTTAAMIQAAAAAVFLVSVVYDARRRAKLREQERRDTIIGALHRLWRLTSDGPTPEEQEGFPYSKRQIEFFNLKLSETGEKWTFPFKRI